MLLLRETRRLPLVDADRSNCEGAAKLRKRAGGSAADLHEAHEIAGVPLPQEVLGWLFPQDAQDLGLQGGVRIGAGQEVAQGMDPVGEEAEAQLTAGGEAEAVAVRAEGMG